MSTATMMSTRTTLTGMALQLALDLGLNEPNVPAVTSLITGEVILYQSEIVEYTERTPSAQVLIKWGGTEKRKVDLHESVEILRLGGERLLARCCRQSSKFNESDGSYDGAWLFDVSANTTARPLQASESEPRVSVEYGGQTADLDSREGRDLAREFVRDALSEVSR